MVKSALERIHIKNIGALSMGHKALIFTDRLLKPFYFLLKGLKSLWPKKCSEPTEFLVIKFFGLGSLTRIAYILKNAKIEPSKITFITLKSNQAIIEQLQLNAIYIRSSNPFYFMADCWKTIFYGWRRKGLRILDMERASNFSGIFSVFLAIRKPATGFYFKAKNKIVGNQTFITLVNKTATESIVEMFGITDFAPSKVELKTVLSNEVIININAGAYLPQRMFPLSKFANLVVKLHQTKPNQTFLLTGSKSEIERVNGFVELLKKEGVVPSQMRNLAGQQNLSEFLTTIQSADLLITNDSGPIHFAHYLGTKTVGIWGPTSSKMVGYPNSDRVLNLVSNEPCSPCFIHPKSKVAKICGGKLTCFQQYEITEMASKIADFMEFSPKNGNIDSE